jgi:hypothetical protein
VPHLLRHGTPIYKVPSERPVIFTLKCRAPGGGTITTYFNVLGLTRSARAGLELKIFRSQGGSFTTEPLRPVGFLHVVTLVTLNLSNNPNAFSLTQIDCLEMEPNPLKDWAMLEVHVANTLF